MFSVHSRVREQDRASFKWSSDGNVKVSKKNGKVVNVCLGQFGLWGCCFPRSGDKGLKATQAYPQQFCSKICALHQKFCLESWKHGGVGVVCTLGARCTTRHP